MEPLEATPLRVTVDKLDIGIDTFNLVICLSTAKQLAFRFWTFCREVHMCLLHAFICFLSHVYSYVSLYKMETHKMEIYKNRTNFATIWLSWGLVSQDKPLKT